jgi:hypothetical protein
LQVRESHPATELMRLPWALAHLRHRLLRSLDRVTKGRVELPSPCGHDVLSVACLPVSPLGRVNDPCGNRTRLCGLRGRRPGPIDERADRFKEMHNASSRSRTCTARRRVGYSHLGTPMPSRRELSVTRAGVEPASSRRFELRRFANLRTVSQHKRPRWDLNPRSPP